MMIDPLSKVGRELKAAEEFFELAKIISLAALRSAVPVAFVTVAAKML